MVGVVFLQVVEYRGSLVAAFLRLSGYLGPVHQQLYDGFVGDEVLHVLGYLLFVCVQHGVHEVIFRGEIDIEGLFGYAQFFAQILNADRAYAHLLHTRCCHLEYIFFHVYHCLLLIVS